MQYDNLNQDSVVKMVKKEDDREQSNSIYTIKFGSNCITQYALESESNLHQILGTPLEESVVETSPCVCHEDEGPGLLKELKYEGIELKLVASQKSKVYNILSIRVTNDKFQTLKGIKIGDDISKLKSQYPKLKNMHERI